MGILLIAALCMLESATALAGEPGQTVEWRSVGNDPGCMRYSELDQINRDSVQRLKPVWTFHTRELEGRTGKTIECTPIVIDGVMYVTTGYLRVVALDAATGKELREVRSAAGLSVLLVHRVASGGGQSRLCLLVGSEARRRAADRSRDIGRPLVLARCEVRQARPEVRRGRNLQSSRRTRSESCCKRLTMGPLSAPVDLARYDHYRRFRAGKDRGIAGAGGYPGVADTHTGKEARRFQTVPGPGEFGNETWKAAIRGKGAVRSQRVGWIQR